MAQRKQETFYWTPYDVLSYNRIFNFVIGNRGCGKTFGMKEYAIKDFLKNRKEFVYVRRYKTEMQDIQKFFADVSAKFPDHEFDVKGTTAYIDGNVAGYFINLSTSSRKKSTPYPNVNKIIFDEFIIDKGSLHYLSNEVEVFLELFETVARSRTDVRAFFLANAISSINPYFLYFETYPNRAIRFTVTKSIIIETVANPQFKEAKKKTPFGELIANTPYGAYAIDNTALRDDETFVKDKFPPYFKCFAVFIYNGRKYGAWGCNGYEDVFFCEKVDPSIKQVFNVTDKDGKPDAVYIKSAYGSPVWKSINTCFEIGCLYFDNQRSKSAFLEIRALYNTRW